MIGLIQRVSSARVEVNNICIAQIDAGLLVLIAVENSDTELDAERLAERICGYRVFGDTADKMNLSVADIHGGVLLVPQFTLAADTDKGMRPSFHPAADPQTGQRLFSLLVDYVAAQGLKPQTGEFGADMQVALINDGPVTFWLQTKRSS
ncbi:MAG: D-tyrosyl-tRNA(Tyr) deacylase [Gammaproteobacteria bacterium]|nr:D-tyrosyl-tRNA(Tyr) deacylase [Gammaproteobacteria bacterium]